MLKKLYISFIIKKKGGIKVKNIKFKVCSLLMSISLSVSLYASTIPKISASNSEDGISVEYLEAVQKGEVEGVSTTLISEEEYVESLAEEKNITISEAQELNDMNSVKCLEKMGLKKGRSTYSNSTDDGYYYVLLEKSGAVDGNEYYSATLTAKIKMYAWNSFRQICSVSYVNTQKKAGVPSSAEWHETDAGTEEGEGDFPLTRVHFYGQGYFTETVNVGSSAVGKILSGFTAGISTGGQITYTSKEVLISVNYECN